MVVSYQYEGVNFAKKNVKSVTFDDVVILHFGGVPDDRRLVLDKKKLSGLNVIEQSEIK